MSLGNVSEYCVWGGQVGGVVFAKRKTVANLSFGCDGANGKLFWDFTEFLTRSLYGILIVSVHSPGRRFFD